MSFAFLIVIASRVPPTLFGCFGNGSSSSSSRSHSSSTAIIPQYTRLTYKSVALFLSLSLSLCPYSVLALALVSIETLSLLSPCSGPGYYQNFVPALSLPWPWIFLKLCTCSVLALALVVIETLSLLCPCPGPGYY